MQFDEESFGIIPLIKQDDTYLVFLVKIASSARFGFPKGHAEFGESAKECAERELFEETHLKVVNYLPFEPFYETYFIERAGKKVHKRVTLFAALVEGELKLQAQEVLEGLWHPLNAIPMALPIYPATTAVISSCRTLLIK